MRLRSLNIFAATAVVIAVAPCVAMAASDRAVARPLQLAQSTSAPASNDAWRPPEDQTRRRSPSEAPGRTRRDYSDRPNPNAAARPGSVERDELAPIGEAYAPESGGRAPNPGEGNGSTGFGRAGFSGDVWRGLEVDKIETLLAEIKPPPRSPVLHTLWRRLMTANAPPPKGRSADAFAAVRARALYRAGLFGEVTKWLGQRPRSENAIAQSVLTLFATSADLGLNHRDTACNTARELSGAASALPDALKGDAILMTGYCAAANGNTAAAGLAAELARDAGMPDSPGLAALSAIAGGRKPAKPRTSNGLTMIDYRILQAANARPDLGNVEKMKPALLVSIASDQNANPITRQLAAEAAFDLNAIDARAVTQIYRDAATVADAASPQQKAASDRAKNFAAADAASDAREKVQRIGAYLKAASGSPFYDSMLRLAFVLSARIEPGPDTAQFADAAILLALTANRPDRARVWADYSTTPGAPGADRAAHWLGLIDIADPGNSTPRDYAGAGGSGAPRPDRGLAALERMAVAGGFKPELLHKLATVLDALAYQIPIPLWEAASRTPQPTEGYLPPTGVLSELSRAAKDRAIGQIALLTMKSIGPNGPAGTHMIALGDTVRALKRAGMDAEAHQLAVEALLPDWPVR